MRFHELKITGTTLIVLLIVYWRRTFAGEGWGRGQLGKEGRKEGRKERRKEIMTSCLFGHIYINSCLSINHFVCCSLLLFCFYNGCLLWLAYLLVGQLGGHMMM
jgi:hypothetical protein